MHKPMRIHGSAGSLRGASDNRAALRTATTLVPASAMRETFALDGIPVLHQGEEHTLLATVVALKRRRREADAMVLVTPASNDSVPSVLKNARDWASRPYGDSAWNGKPAAMAIGTARVPYHLRRMLVYLHRFPINHPARMIGNAAARFDQEGTLTDATTQACIRQLLQHRVAWTRRIGQP